MGLTPHARPVTAETSALNTAFSLRADYERAVIAADSAYASALAAGNSQAFADLAAAISAKKFAAIDPTVAGESPLLRSLEHWPFTAEGTLRNVAIDQYRLNVDSVLDAIAACHGRRLWAARALLDHCRPLQRCTGGPNLPPVHISVVLTPHSSWDFADRAGPHPADAGRSPGLGRGDVVPRGG